LRTRLVLQHGAGIRFASTTPAAPIIPTSTPPIAAPIDATASSAASLPATSFDSAIDFSSQSILDIPERIGYLKDLGLDYGYGPTGLMEFILEHIHIYAGTPWWASIALTAIFVRAVMFKPYMDASDNASRMATIQHLTKPVTDKMRAAAALGDSNLTMELRNELSRINARAGIKIWKSFVPMTQVFTGIGTLFLLRAMSNLPVPGLETGGALWFYNLTIPDPFFILPLATAGVLHWVLRVSVDTLFYT
jgi:YidC/Oxa1 family membrane protein insertase